MGFPQEKQIRNLVKDYVIKLLSSAYVFFFLYYAYTGFLERARFSLFFLLFSLTASSLRFMLDPSSSFFRVIRGKSLVFTSLILTAISISTTLYLMINFNYLSWSVGANTTVDFIVAFLLLIPILLMAWKRGGTSLIILILIALFFVLPIPLVLRFSYLSPKYYLRLIAALLQEQHYLIVLTDVCLPRLYTYVFLYFLY